MTFSSTGAITDSTLNAIKNSFAKSLQSNMYPVSPSDISLSIKTTLIRSQQTTVVAEIKMTPDDAMDLIDDFGTILSDLNTQLVNDAILVTLDNTSQPVSVGCGKQ